MIRITDRIVIDEADIEETFITAGGPGGQHVNKTATAVQIRFDPTRSTGIDDAVRSRLFKLAGRRVTVDGKLVITARRFRSQARNRDDAVARLAELIRKASSPPTRRKPTKVPAGTRARRVQEKRHTSQIKRMRRAPGPEKGSE